MILKLHLPFRRTILQASLPFLLYSLICCLETTLLYDGCSLLQSSKNILLGLYSSYPIFMLAMLILNGIIDAVKGPKEAEPIHKGNKIIPQMIRNCLCFTLIYACFQLITGSLPQQELSENLSLNTTINGLKEVPRILEGETSEDYLMRDTSDIELFEVGKIIGSRTIAESAMTISKDGKTVFLIEEKRGVLRIVDISDNQDPKMLSILTLDGISSTARALLLSADEKVLYTSMGTLLEIIDISNLKSPVSLNSIRDYDLLSFRGQVDLEYFLSIQTSMAFSWKEKALYVGGSNVFQIFSVENPKEAQLIFSSAKNCRIRTTFATSVATSADGKTLYFANGTIAVSDISLDPLKPVLQSTFTGASSLNSLLLGKDNKTLYAAGRAGVIITLEKIALEESSPFLKSLEAFNLGVSSASPPSILEKSLSESTLFLFTTQYLKSGIGDLTLLNPLFRAYNLIDREILSHSKDLFPNTTGTLCVIPNTKNFVISKNEQFHIVSFFSNYPNLHSFGLSNNTMGVYKPRDGFIQLTVSSTLGIDRLYTITVIDQKSYFNIVEMSNKNNPEILVSSPLEDFGVQSLHVVDSANRAFVIGKYKEIQVLDFSDLPRIQNLGLIKLRSTGFDFSKFYPFKDGKTFLIPTLDQPYPVTQLKMFDFSDISSVKMIAEETINKYSNSFMGQESSQGITFLCFKTEILIYNFSAPISPQKIGSIAFPSASQDLVKCSLFEEKGIFFLETYNEDTMHSLSIFNISDINPFQVGKNKNFSSNLKFQNPVSL